MDTLIIALALEIAIREGMLIEEEIEGEEECEELMAEELPNNSLVKQEEEEEVEEEGLMVD